MKVVSAKDTDQGEAVDDVSIHKDCLLVGEEPEGASREYIKIAREHLGVEKGKVPESSRTYFFLDDFVMKFD